jgi:SAM-dependent methyltransferase
VAAQRRFPDHFSVCADRYVACRPGQPPELIEHLARLAPERGLAWDAGTGNGQAAVLLADRFERVVATDASAEEIARAAPNPRIEYRVEPAEAPSLAPGSVDLVTVAQALHWFDRPRFHAAVARVLRRGGVIAAWCYREIRIEPEIDAIVGRFYSQRVGRFWPPQRRDVENGYRDLGFPFDELPSGEWAIRATKRRWSGQ